MTPRGTPPLTHNPLGGNHTLCAGTTSSPQWVLSQRPRVRGDSAGLAPCCQWCVPPGKFCLTSKNCDSPTGKWRPQHLPPGAVPRLRGRGLKLEITWKSFKEEKSRPFRAATQLRLVISLYLANHHTLGPTKLLLQPHPRVGLGKKLGA